MRVSKKMHYPSKGEGENFVKSHFESFFFYCRKFSKGEAVGQNIELFERKQSFLLTFLGLPNKQNFVFSLKNGRLYSLIYYFLVFYCASKQALNLLNLKFDCASSSLDCMKWTPLVDNNNTLFS